MFYGTAGQIRPGDRVPADGMVTADRAEAQARAWRAAENDRWCRLPHVYGVAAQGEGLIVVGDACITGGMAWRAIELGGPA